MVRVRDIETLRKIIGPIGPNHPLVFEDGSELCMELGSLDDTNAVMVLSKVDQEDAEKEILFDCRHRKELRCIGNSHCNNNCGFYGRK